MSTPTDIKGSGTNFDILLKGLGIPEALASLKESLRRGYVQRNVTRSEAWRHLCARDSRQATDLRIATLRCF